MGQSGRLSDLDKFHSVFQHVWKSKNEFQRCWNGFSVVRCEKKPKQLKKQHSVSAVPVQAGGCTGTTIAEQCSDGCTGTRRLYRYKTRATEQPEPRVCSLFRCCAGLVPVQETVYRYKGAAAAG
uniref:Uncharacterized protein n=1 Tax=Ananas comosus var. bracteatus TaxID=296719 RepID=A0A6V7Q9F9_ANACO|nr:unnamed protein product [Ananas comosus var. bracteatus]